MRSHACDLGRVGTFLPDDSLFLVGGSLSVLATPTHQWSGEKKRMNEDALFISYSVITGFKHKPDDRIYPAMTKRQHF